MTTKTCTKCGREKPLDNFYRSSRIKSGRQAECKECGLARKRLGRERQQADDPAPAGLLSSKEAAQICRDLTGHKVTAGYIRSQAANFPQIAEWGVSNYGGDKFRGIIKPRFVALIRGRLATRGRCPLKDLFSTEEV